MWTKVPGSVERHSKQQLTEAVGGAGMSKTSLVPSVVPEGERQAHMAAVEVRYASHAGGGADHLQARANVMTAIVSGASRQRLLRHAMTAKTVGRRIMWLRREADLMVDAARNVSPCSSGCAHCCHIATLVAEPEANEIGRAIGRKPADPPAGAFARLEAGSRPTDLSQALQERHFGAPCVFLRGAACSIYGDRPLACRLLISVDEDALLCRLVPGETITAPYIDTGMQRMAYLVAMAGHGHRWADIRDWFPRVDL